MPESALTGLRGHAFLTLDGRTATDQPDEARDAANAALALESPK